MNRQQIRARLAAGVDPATVSAEVDPGPTRAIRVRCPICGHEGAARLPRDGRHVGDTTVWCPRRHKPARELPAHQLLPDGTCMGRYEEGEFISRCFTAENDQ